MGLDAGVLLSAIEKNLQDNGFVLTNKDDPDRAQATPFAKAIADAVVDHIKNNAKVITEVAHAKEGTTTGNHKGKIT